MRTCCFTTSSLDIYGRRGLVFLIYQGRLLHGTWYVACSEWYIWHSILLRLVKFCEMVPTKHKQLQKQKLTLVSKLCMFHSGIIGLFHQEFVQCSNNPNMTVYLQHIAHKNYFPSHNSWDIVSKFSRYIFVSIRCLRTTDNVPNIR